MFVFLKMVQLLVAAAIPVAAAADASNVVVATLGAGVVLLQGLDQLTQLGRRYVASTNAEARMQRETILWKTGAGSYATAGDPDLQFAERVVEIESDWRALFSELALESLHPEDEEVAGRVGRPPPARADGGSRGASG